MDIRQFSLYPPAAGRAHTSTANVYLLERGNARWLIDTGYGISQLDAILGGSTEPEDLRGIVLTHRHPAHAGGARDLMLRGLPVYVRPPIPHSSPPGLGALGVARAESTCGRVSREIELFPGRERFVGESSSLPEAEEALVLALPGHTWDGLGVYLPRRRALFSGDLLLPGRAVPTLSCGDALAYLSFGESTLFSANLLVALRDSLRRLESLEDFVLYPGHGEPVEEGKDLLRHVVRQVEDRLLLVRDRVHRPCTAFEVARELFPRAVRKDPAKAAVEVALYLDVLVREGFLRLEWETCLSGQPCAHFLPPDRVRRVPLSERA
ncbi:MAG: MBL fold metallo-hydrolase [Brockia lithotrophica]|nr:MBL fold metallo-hydrolase [Brockia lithotrophica]